VPPRKTSQNDGRGHCCIKAKGVLAVHQSSESGPSNTLENRNKPGIQSMLRGFWAGKWISSGGPNAQCNSAFSTGTTLRPC
jgi:hypothetical protein